MGCTLRLFGTTRMAVVMFPDDERGTFQAHVGGAKGTRLISGDLSDARALIAKLEDDFCHIPGVAAITCCSQSGVWVGAGVLTAIQPGQARTTSCGARPLVPLATVTAFTPVTASLNGMLTRTPTGLPVRICRFGASSVKSLSLAVTTLARAQLSPQLPVVASAEDKAVLA